MTMMHVLMYACVLRECEGASVTAMLVWGTVRYGWDEYRA